MEETVVVMLVVAEVATVVAVRTIVEVRTGSGRNRNSCHHCRDSCHHDLLPRWS